MDYSLMWVKVFLILLAGVLFFWWQFRDLANARKARENLPEKLSDSASDEQNAH
jgi:hypothetical protein